MKDFIVYHNPDAMEYSAREVDSLAVFTNKRVSADVMGDRVWLLTGEGTPRNYFLVCWFIVESVSSGLKFGFETQIEGNVGKLFDPLVPIDRDADWFKKLKKDQGNFAFGFNPINDADAISNFERLAM